MFRLIQAIADQQTSQAGMTAGAIERAGEMRSVGEKEVARGTSARFQMALIRIFSAVLGKVRDDRRLLLGMDERLLADIGISRDEVLFGAKIESNDGGDRDRTQAWRMTVLTTIVVIVSWTVAIFMPGDKSNDVLRVSTCALLPTGMMGSRWAPLHCYVNNCARRGLPKHVC